MDTNFVFAAKLCGVYRIVATGTGEQYVGSAMSIRSRWIRHRQELRMCEHHCRRLQACVDLYGVDSIIFSIVEVVPDCKDLVAREQYWIDEIKPELNILTRAGRSGRLTQRSVEQNQRTSRGLRIAYGSPDGRETQRKRIAAAWDDPVMREAMLAKRAAALIKNPRRGRSSARQKLKWQDPEFKLKMAGHLRNLANSQKRKDAAALAVKRPEVRQRISVGIRRFRNDQLRSVAKKGDAD